MMLSNSLQKVKYNRTYKPTTYLQTNQYSESLKQKFFDQMNKVYSNCIHPTQFLSQLFTNANTALILQVRIYITAIGPQIKPK